MNFIIIYCMFLAPTGALGVKILCVRASVRDIMLKNTLKEFLGVLKGLTEGQKRGP